MVALKKCTECGSARVYLATGKYKGIPYTSYRCKECGDEVFTMEQAKSLANAVEDARKVTFSKWGETLAVRIPADVVRRLHLKPKSKGKLIEEANGFKIVPFG